MLGFHCGRNAAPFHVKRKTDDRPRLPRKAGVEERVVAQSGTTVRARPTKTAGSTTCPLCFGRRHPIRMVLAVVDVDGVERWQTVTLRWLGHRPEPLITERLWGCPLVLGDHDRDERGWRHRVGFDRDGRPVVLRHETSREGFATEGWDEIVSYQPGRVEVSHGAGRLTTTFDTSGRAERTVYV